MSTKTDIEWTDTTWNPVRGCSLVSAGCANCYAMKFAHRFSGKGKPYEGLTELGPQGPRWTGKIRLVPEALEEPLHWKQPRRIFVNSMSDLFHEDVPNEFIDRVFAVMAIAKQHTYQILTKRPERMRDYFIRLAERPSRRLYESVRGMFRYKGFTGELGPEDTIPTGISVPFPNVWLGVSVEDQATADERIPILLQTPAAVRFISVEPLLEPIFLGRSGAIELYRPGYEPGESVHLDEEPDFPQLQARSKGLHWVIIGGESGPGARPCNLAWIRSIKDQCEAAKVPVFVKQLGREPYVIHKTGNKNWIGLKDKKGGDISEFPLDLQVREYPHG